jgi:2-amino-4-hydroxy-6-hydroxymethyldihydropteridine diphosphokinase
MAITIYLLLGSNEGDRLHQLRSAVQDLEARLACGPVICSGVYETAAWGIEDQPAFLNMAAAMETRHSPDEVLAAVHEVEQRFGRQRTVQWGQRTLDVDILFFGDRIIDQPNLIVPHPQLQDRRFALVPMAEIAPDLMHPVRHMTIKDLLLHCPDHLAVTLLQN